MRSIRRGFLLLTLLTLASNLLAQQSSTTVPNLIRYGGVLKDAQGVAMVSRTVGITFLIYGQQEGGAPVWLETQNVATDAAGHYSVLLGSATATGLPSDLFSAQEERWLAVKAEGQPEQPRVLLVSVPYAMKAAEADRLAGHSASEFVTTDNLQTAVKQQLQSQTTVVNSGGQPQPLAPSAYINNGTVQQTGANFNIDGTGTAAILNATSNYNLGGTAVLGNSGTQGMFLGAGAGQNNTGSYNLFLGIAAGHNTTAADYNTFIGTNAGYFNTTGTQNFMLGATAGYHNTTGSYNMFVGSLAGYNNTTGTRNAFVGRAAGYGNTTGTGNSFFGANAGSASTADFNTFLGGFSGTATTTGNHNTFVGWQAGQFNVTGSNNLFLGYNAGSAAGTAAANNVYLASPGAAADSGVIRIGSTASQTAAYIAGINGASTTSGVPVFVDSTGKLGTTGGNFNLSGNVSLTGDLSATSTTAGGSAITGTDNSTTGNSKWPVGHHLEPNWLRRNRYGNHHYRRGNWRPRTFQQSQRSWRTRSEQHRRRYCHIWPCQQHERHSGHLGYFRRDRQYRQRFHRSSRYSYGDHRCYHWHAWNDSQHYRFLVRRLRQQQCYDRSGLWRHRIGQQCIQFLGRSERVSERDDWVGFRSNRRNQ